jgi:RNA polymerase sigma-70 factor, ECF subfamily
MDSADDAELMLRYARGDMRAFETLYSRHRGALYRYLARHTRDRDVANDLFQEVWSKVIASRSRYEPRAKFQTFLFRIAHNCFIDHCRRAANHAQPAATGDELWHETLPAPESEMPDRHAERSEMVARYRVALLALPAEQRDVFLLYEETGLSLEEIATITGVGVETAKSRLRYALGKLRHALAAPSEEKPAERSVLPGSAAVQEPGV